MIFKYRDNIPLSFPISAEDAYHALEAIRLKFGGRLDAKAVVDESRPAEAPLHPCFEWRNAVAAEKYRHWQSRNLVKAVVIKDDSEKCHPAFVNVVVASDDGKGKAQFYQATEVAITRPDEWAAAITAASIKAEAAQAAVQALVELAKKEGDDERMQRVTIAVLAMATARDAVHRLM